MVSLSVIMPCFNRASDLNRVLQAYDSQGMELPFEVIAIDDASSDGTYQVLENYHPKNFALKIQRLEKNSGPAAARNLGIALAEGRVILFVGDDILPAPDLVRGHLAAHRRFPGSEVAILGNVSWANDLPVNTLMEHIDGVGAQQFSYSHMLDEHEYDFRHFYTANISIQKDFLLDIDPWFDRDFQYAAFEDVELAYRLSKKGLRILYTHILDGYHYHFHNIWTFSTRQYRSGLMACVLGKKHPELNRVLMGRSWPLKKTSWRVAADFANPSYEKALWLEAEINHLLSAFEWVEHPWLNWWYLRVLKYYYWKGIIYGTFEREELSRKVHALIAQRALVPVLYWIYQTLGGDQGELLEGHGLWVLNSYQNQ